MSDVHIASYIVQSQPILLEDVKEVILGFENLTIPIMDEGQGKLIAIMERGSSKALELEAEKLKQVNGVMSVTLVYHHTEDMSELEQELR